MLLGKLMLGVAHNESGKGQVDQTLCMSFIVNQDSSPMLPSSYGPLPIMVHIAIVHHVQPGLRPVPKC